MADNVNSSSEMSVTSRASDKSMSWNQLVAHFSWLCVL